MGLFGKKKPEPTTEPKLDVVTNLGRKRVLNLSDKAIRLAFKGKRLMFSDDAIAYTDKQGNTKRWVAQGTEAPIDQFAVFMFDRLNKELESHAMFGYAPSMAAVSVTVNDIRDIILKIRDGG